MQGSAERSRRGRHIAILMFHSVAEDGGEYSIDQQAFRRFLEFISGEYEVISLGKVAAVLQESSDRGPLVVLTFDDAFDDYYESAFPVLLALSLPSTLFVPTGFIGKRSSWDPPMRNVIPKNIMNAERILELSQTGIVEVGSHTVDHLSMRRLGEDDMYRQARDSKDCLEKLLGRPVWGFAYPYGMKDDHSDKTMGILRRSGYEAAVTSNWGTFQGVDDLLRLKRIQLVSRDSLSNVRRKIEGFYDWYWAKEGIAYLARSTMRWLRRES